MPIIDRQDGQQNVAAASPPMAGPESTRKDMAVTFALQCGHTGITCFVPFIKCRSFYALFDVIDPHIELLAYRDTME